MRTRDYMNILKTIAEHEETSIEEVEIIDCKRKEGKNENKRLYEYTENDC